ncbi:adenylate cyclase [Thiomicrospira sp. WB1]|nr:adenylate cyclase [Thiomicrospira sp. WB1]
MTQKDWYQPFENKLNDQLLVLRGVQPVDPNIVIVDIDEKSLKARGQWPWPRDQVAELLRKLTGLGAGMIGLDMVFAESDNSSPKRVFERLGRETDGLPDYDQRLAEAIAETPTITGYVFIQNPDGIDPGRLPTSRAMILERDKPAQSYLFQPYRAVLNLPILQESAYASGYFNSVPDADGVVRSVPLVMQYEQMLFPALSLEMLRVISGQRRIEVQYEHQGVNSVSMGPLHVPTDANGQMRLNFRGPAFSYPYVSAVDVLEGEVVPADLAGKIVLLGTSASGLMDLRATPLDSVYPGVEVHATAIDNMLNQDFLAQPMWTLGADVVTLLVGLMLIGLALMFTGSVLSFVVALTLIAGLVVAHYYLLVSQGLIFNTVVPWAAFVMLFGLGTVINYFFESRQKAKIRKRFAQKVSPAVVEELINHADDVSLEGKEQEVTLFFSDIRSFTTMSEKMGSARALITLLNRYMTPMVEVITKRQGTVDKFIGDAIMAYWNAPIEVEQHADEALTASVEQILALEDLNQTLAQDELPRIDIGIGLNTGVVVVGEMGSVGRSDYTCIGDAVNLASRAEGLCKPYSAKIVLTEFTVSALAHPDRFQMRFLDKVRVKGKSEPVSIYECLGFAQNDQAWYTMAQEERTLFDQAQMDYHEGRFSKALEGFRQLQTRWPQPLYDMYQSRCKHYVKHPPESFDGVFTLESK